MAERSHQNAVQRWFADLWSKGDLDTADQIIAPDYAPEWIQIAASGPEQVKHEVRYFRAVFPDLHYEIVDTAAQDNKIWVRYRASGTHTGAAWGFDPTGRQATFEGVTIFSLGPEGKIVDRWGSFCFYDILSELDLVPPFWELSKTLSSRHGNSDTINDQE